MAIITEVMTPRDIETVYEYTDIFQIGARNSQNYYLLEEVGKAGKPVMLKRGLSMLMEEWLLAAEYVLSQGNPNVIFCERGIRTFENPDPEHARCRRRAGDAEALAPAGLRRSRAMRPASGRMSAPAPWPASRPARTA